VAFVAPSFVIYAPEAPERFLLRVGPASAARAGGYRDFEREAAEQPGEYLATRGVRSSDSASPDGTSYEAWGRLARELAEMYGLRPGDRVLVDAAAHEHPVKWLLAPLSVGASIVLCANLDPAAVPERTAREGITRIL
jgi:hypothetical protein